MSQRAIVRTFVIGNCLLGLGALGGVFGALPVRYWAVDTCTVLLAVLLFASAWGMARDLRWGLSALRVSALCELALGLAALAALALGISYLGGVHGAVGKSGLNALILGSLLIAPYLIAYPSLQLLWIHGRAGASR
jgi:hypothetical protein